MVIQSNYIALAVKDIQKSNDFYTSIGFSPVEGAGSVKDKWMLVHNGTAKIGLFEGMFPHNTLTFNSDKVREFYKLAQKNGVETQRISESMKKEEGPCSFVMVDPDGNPILFDQH